MTDKKETLAVNVNVEITAESLQAIVENVKKQTGRDSKGVYRVDTADKVSQMISRFLFENDFESYTKDIKNYL
ncbi:MAG: hypothetical protein JRJ76_08620 [Deltaproteobacteria bacterium]|nr:hypothetical protein [Deltaproteobacteria bacterium]MBW1848247.1 hypothetical protein [Deltaproteobacteria bacterium]MBW2180531.1 hypothetical protein [Deltaproteobacteria bacterium]MBW2365282.1 hypothetical protein [Deltaproteobacteria bacterium]